VGSPLTTERGLGSSELAATHCWKRCREHAEVCSGWRRHVGVSKKGKRPCGCCGRRLNFGVNHHLASHLFILRTSKFHTPTTTPRRTNSQIHTQINQNGTYSAANTCRINADIHHQAPAAGGKKQKKKWSKGKGTFCVSSLFTQRNKLGYEVMDIRH
jgi:hypothetical protein